MKGDFFSKMIFSGVAGLIISFVLLSMADEKVSLRPMALKITLAIAVFFLVVITGKLLYQLYFTIRNKWK